MCVATGAIYTTTPPRAAKRETVEKAAELARDVSDEGAADQARCPGGRASGSGATACDVCAAGTFAEPGSSSCAPCSPGKFSSGQSVSCADCADREDSRLGGLHIDTTEKSERTETRDCFFTDLC